MNPELCSGFFYILKKRGVIISFLGFDFNIKRLVAFVMPANYSLSIKVMFLRKEKSPRY